MIYLRFLSLVLLISTPALAADNVPVAKVVSEDGAGDTRKLALRLDARMPEADLKAYATRLRDKAAAGKKPAVVSFYLPGTTLGQSPWALVRFEPETRVSINGLRFEEVKAFASEAAKDQRDVVGVWLTAAPALPGMLTIWRDKKGRHFSEWSLRTGAKTSDELEAVKTSRGRRFGIKGSNGGYYLATWSGELELGEGASVIATAERLTVEKEKPPVAAAPVSAPAGVPGPKAAAPLKTPVAPDPAASVSAPASVVVKQDKPKALKAVRRQKKVAANAAPERGQSVGDSIQTTLSR